MTVKRNAPAASPLSAQGRLRADCGLVTRRSLLPVSNRFHLNSHLLSFIWTLPMNLELLFKCLILAFPRLASTFLTIQPRPWHCRGQGFHPPRLHQTLPKPKSNHFAGNRTTPWPLKRRLEHPLRFQNSALLRSSLNVQASRRLGQRRYGLFLL